MAPDPYVSVVATSRNDDHGGNMLRRMQIFVNGWIEQCRRHDLASELVLVEWNPPAERAPLAEALRWPKDPGPCTVRIITVPEAVHRRLRHSESLPLFQMIAKNVGIRRARAPFVLATNVDILFGDELMGFFAARRLEAGRFYRIDRSDAMSDVPLEARVAEQLTYCRTHLLRVNEREATFPFPDAADFRADQLAASPISPGAGLGMDRRPTGEPYFAGSQEGHLVVKPPASGPRVLRLDVEAGPTPDGEALALELDDESGRRIAQLAFASPVRVFIPLPQAGSQDRSLRVAVRRIAARAQAPSAVHFRIFEPGWATVDELRQEYGAADREAEHPRAVRPRDVYDLAEGVSLHEGWGPREYTADGSLRRPVSDGARFSSYVPAQLPGGLALELEAVPGHAVDVEVINDTGTVVARQTVAGRGRIGIPNGAAARRTRYSIRFSDVPQGAAPVSIYALGLSRHGVGPKLRRLLRPLKPPRVDFAHTNACGDFTLMHRDGWFRLRGYPEWEAYSMNIDGFTCFAAAASGLQEVVLREPMRIYHIEHGLGSGWSPEGEQRLLERIRSRGITWIAKDRVLELARRMYRQGPIVVNHDDWGFGRESLTEVEPGRQGAATPVVARG